MTGPGDVKAPDEVWLYQNIYGAMRVGHPSDHGVVRYVRAATPAPEGKPQEGVGVAATDSATASVKQAQPVPPPSCDSPELAEIRKRLSERNRRLVEAAEVAIRDAQNGLLAGLAAGLRAAIEENDQ